jgi:diguanylate cyclase (GGDEF)-like protein
MMPLGLFSPLDRVALAGLEVTLEEIRATVGADSWRQRVRLLFVWLVRWCGFTAPLLAAVMMFVNPASAWPWVSLAVYLSATVASGVLAWWYSNAAAPSAVVTWWGLVCTYMALGFSMGILIRPALDASDPRLAATMCLLFTCVSLCVGLLGSSGVPASFHAFSTVAIWLFIVHLAAERTAFATWLAVACLVVWASVAIVGVRLHRIIHDMSEGRFVEADLSVRLASALEALDRIASIDELTGVGNRRQFVSQLEQCLAQTPDAPVCLVLFDIDHFKTVNDTYGHGVGDEVLRRVAGAAAGSMGDHAVIGRIGGEEFAVLFSAADECSGAAAAEHIRTEIAGLRFDEYPGVHVTASFGVALLQPGFSAAAALRTADEALYRAKRGGRNRVELAGLSSPARP